MASTRSHSEIPLATIALLTAFVESGCKPDGGGGGGDGDLGDIGRLYLDFVDVLGDGYAFYCECLVEAGYYDSFELCWQPAVPPPLAECTAAVLDNFSEVATNLECLFQGYSEFFACQEEAGCNGDANACYEFLDVIETCPEIPYEVNAAVQLQCYGRTLPAPFACGDGTSIPETWQCDGAPDCTDGSDEQNCPMFACGDGTEILLTEQCDGTPDCENLSDEQNCPGQFTCGDGYGIPIDWQCDGYPDCEDQTDEQGC